MVKMTTEMNRTTMQPLFQILIRQGNLSTALLDSGSNVSLVKRKFLQSLGFKCALEVGNGKILRANSTTMPVKSKAELTVQPEKIEHKIRVSVLTSTLETFNSLQGLNFRTKSDCIYFAKEQKLFFGKLCQTLQLNPSPTKNDSMFLILFSTQIVPTMSEKLVPCKFKEKRRFEVSLLGMNGYPS